jgi:hypothetical protein
MARGLSSSTSMVFPSLTLPISAFPLSFWSDLSHTISFEGFRMATSRPSRMWRSIRQHSKLCGMTRRQGRRTWCCRGIAWSLSPPPPPPLSALTTTHGLRMEGFSLSSPTPVVSGDIAL